MAGTENPTPFRGFKNYRYDSKDPSRRHSFEMHGLDISIINAIRRIILTDIPIVGILGEETEGYEIGTQVLENNGPLHNEYIQHRIGLVPLHLSETETESFEADSWEFSLEAENTGKEMMDVTTHDIVVTRNEQRLSEKERNRILPVDPITQDPILLTRLRAGERLRLVAHPMLGTARIHAGFSPVSLCAFSFQEDPVAVSQLPQDDILARERAYLRNEYGDPLAVTLQLEIEQGGLTPSYLVHKALDILIQKLDSIPEDLHAEQGGRITHQPTPAEFGGAGYQFSFDKEDDTLGNLLQSHLHVHYIRSGDQLPSGERLAYVGYVCPHPLQHRMLLRMVVHDAAANSEVKDPQTYISLLSDTAHRLKIELQELQDQWRLFLV